MLLGAFLDPLVDRPKDFLVVGGRIGEVHEAIVPRSVPKCQTRRRDEAIGCADEAAVRRALEEYRAEYPDTLFGATKLRESDRANVM